RSNRGAARVPVPTRSASSSSLSQGARPNIAPALRRRTKLKTLDRIRSASLPCQHTERVGGLANTLPALASARRLSDLLGYGPPRLFGIPADGIRSHETHLHSA